MKYSTALLLIFLIGYFSSCVTVGENNTDKSSAINNIDMKTISQDGITINYSENLRDDDLFEISTEIYIDGTQHYYVYNMILSQELFLEDIYNTINEYFFNGNTFSAAVNTGVLHEEKINWPYTVRLGYGSSDQSQDYIKDFLLEEGVDLEIILNLENILNKIVIDNPF